MELVGLGEGGAGHAGELLVHAEVVLDRHGGDGDVLLLDPHALLGLDGLVQALRPAPALHDAARELVDDLDLAVHDHVLVVALVELLGLDRLDQVVHELAVLGRVEVLDADGALDLRHAVLGRRGRVELLVDLVVGAQLEVGDGAREGVVGVGGLLRLARDDERRPRLVDQDRVDLVDDRVPVAALDGLGELDRHVVAQVVEAELGVRAVGDVAGVGGAAVGLLVVVGHLRLDDADAHPERLVDRAHPLGVALGQVVVHGDELDVHAGERVQIERERGDEGLSLARLHLGDPALVEHHAADQLDVEVAHADRALGGLADARERLGQEVVEILALVEALAELLRLGAERVVGERGDLVLEGVDLVHALVEPLEGAALARAQDLLEDAHGAWMVSNDG